MVKAVMDPTKIGSGAGFRPPRFGEPKYISQDDNRKIAVAGAVSPIVQLDTSGTYTGIRPGMLECPSLETLFESCNPRFHWQVDSRRRCWHR